MFKMIHNFNKEYTQALIKSGIVNSVDGFKITQHCLTSKKIVLMKLQRKVQSFIIWYQNIEPVFILTDFTEGPIILNMNMIMIWYRTMKKSLLENFGDFRFMGLLLQELWIGAESEIK